MTAHRPHPHAFTLGTQRQEVMLKDGTSVTLLAVLDHDQPSATHRAFDVFRNGKPPLLVDLRQLAPSLGADLASAPMRDRWGLVFFSMRQRFATAEHLLRAVLEHGRPITSEVTA